MIDLSKCETHEALKEKLQLSEVVRITPIIITSQDEFRTETNVIYYGVFNSETINDKPVLLNVYPTDFINFQGYEVTTRFTINEFNPYGNSTNSITAFNCYGDIVDPCNYTPSGLESYDETLYHNGSQTLPQLGDTIFSTSDGTELVSNTHALLLENGSFVSTNNEGIMHAFSCL